MLSMKIENLWMTSARNGGLFAAEIFCSKQGYMWLAAERERERKSKRYRNWIGSSNLAFQSYWNQTCQIDLTWLSKSRNNWVCFLDIIKCVRERERLQVCRTEMCYIKGGQWVWENNLDWLSKKIENVYESLFVAPSFSAKKDKMRRRIFVDTWKSSRQIR